MGYAHVAHVFDRGSGSAWGYSSCAVGMGIMIVYGVHVTGLRFSGVAPLSTIVTRRSRRCIRGAYDDALVMDVNGCQCAQRLHVTALGHSCLNLSLPRVSYHSKVFVTPRVALDGVGPGKLWIKSSMIVHATSERHSTVTWDSSRSLLYQLQDSPVEMD